MKKKITLILAVLLIVAVVSGGCQFGSPTPAPGGEESAAAAVEVDYATYPNNLYGVLCALSDQKVLNFSDSEITTLLNYFKEDVGEDVDERTAIENKISREQREVGKLANNIRVMNAALVGAARGVRLQYKNNTLKQDVVLEIYEFTPEGLLESRAVKSVSETGTFELDGFDTVVKAEMIGNYMLIYSDDSTEGEHLIQTLRITYTLEKISLNEGGI